MKIQKPTLGRVVEVQGFAVEGGARRAYVGLVESADSKGLAVIHVFAKGLVNLVMENVPHDGDGAKAPSWRYPPRCTDEIEVER